MKKDLIKSSFCWVAFLLFSLYLGYFEREWNQSIIAFGLSWIFVFNVFMVMFAKEQGDKNV